MTDRLRGSNGAYLKASDDMQRAAEVIDRDPEAALAKVQPGVVTTDGSPVTVQDMFGLFVQLQKQQAAMQEQLVNLLTHQQQRENRSASLTREELAAAEAQKRATLASWQVEPREPVWIEPDLSEQKLAATTPNGELPPRSFWVNGILYPIPVGRIVEVPHSIAELVRYTQNPKSKPTPYDMRAHAQPIPQIPDPPQAQFLAGSQEVSPGYAGKVGEGRLPITTAAEPQPLDVRYDAYGR